MGVEEMNWSDMKKVCKPRSGQANSKAYRYVKYWQPPLSTYMDIVIDNRSSPGFTASGYCCLGRVDYAGPMRSTHYMDRGRFHRMEGCYLVAWWHLGKNRLRV